MSVVLLICDRESEEVIYSKISTDPTLMNDRGLCPQIFYKEKQVEDEEEEEEEA